MTPHGLGWNLPHSAKKLHYFLDGSSLCMRYTDYGRPLMELDKPLPLRHFCRTCMRLMCDKIVIAGIPVDVAPIRTYIRKYKKHHDENDVDKLVYKLLETADFGAYSEYVWMFRRDLNGILEHALSCPRCYISVDREGTCEECGRFITVKDGIKILEKIADISRRS